MPHLRRLLAPQPPVIERDVTSLELEDGRRIEIQRVRNPRARRLRLSVDERGALGILMVMVRMAHPTGG